MRPNRVLSRNRKKMLPNISIPVRIIPRTNCEIRFCTCVMSLVIRVTSEPVPKQSTYEKTNY